MKNYLKQTLFCTVFISGFLLWGNAQADTHTVSGNCSASAVQTAIDGASSGDIIDVTCTGTVTWSSAITLSGGKILKGGGTKGSSGTNGTWPLTINVTSSGDAAVIIINDNSEPVNQLTGFKFQGTGSPVRVIFVQGRGTGIDGKGAFRIDNNYIDQVPFGSRVIKTDGTGGKMTGVIDHNVLYYPPARQALSSYENIAKGSSQTCYGHDSAYRSNGGFGSDDFVFWEDNYMYNHGFDNADGGGRIVLRYNEIASDITSSSFDVLDGHGSTGAECIGIVRNEMYKNTISGDMAYSHITNMRGGEWLVYNNVLPKSGVLQLEEYRITGPQYLGWRTCSGNFCCPTTPAQCNVQAPGINDIANCYPLLNQVRNTFLWNNIQDSRNASPTYSGNNATLKYYIVRDRDYFMPAYDTEAKLPTTCTTGDYYGATDSGKLWKCTSTNNWTLQYTPFTYPHPLRTEATDIVAPASPTGLAVQ